MEKILFVARADEHIAHFHYPYLKWFKKKGYEVHVASRGEEEFSFIDKKYNLSFERSPLSLANYRAYRRLKKIIKENDYKVIHCHTPVGGAIARLAALAERKKELKVIYTAHGCHFYKGAPIKNWLLYYPVEKILSRFTDIMILINEEDYRLALNNNFKAKRIEYVKGLGIDLDKFPAQTPETKKTLRKEYSYSDKDFILIYVGQLRAKKNQEMLINAVKIIKDEIPGLKLLLVGDGDCRGKYNDLIKKLNVEQNVELLGYRKDISELMLLSDIAVSSSLQEGLPVNIMEAMATGLPLLVSDCRGHRDLVVDGQNGFIFDINDIRSFKEKVIKLYLNRDLANIFGKKSRDMADQYSLAETLLIMEEIYVSVLDKE